MPGLETVKLEGVAVMAAGGPYRAKGSPPGGDFYDDATLQRIADASNRYTERGELRSINKIGHDPQQRLLAASGITDGEKPSAGWLRNFRVDGGKLKADIENVPKKLADLIKVGAYRTRSAELRSLESQTGSGEREPVVTGLAWLGATSPAIRTLDDIHAYYEADPDEDVTIVDYTEETVWDPDRGFRWVQSEIQAALERDYKFNPNQPRAKDGKWRDVLSAGGNAVMSTAIGWNAKAGGKDAPVEDWIKTGALDDVYDYLGVEKKVPHSEYDGRELIPMAVAKAEIAHREAELRKQGHSFSVREELKTDLEILRKKLKRLDDTPTVSRRVQELGFDALPAPTKRKKDKGVKAGRFRPDFMGPKVYVADVGPESALVIEMAEDGEAAWVVDFQIDGDELTIAPQDKWVLSYNGWSERTREYVDACERAARGTADTSGVSEMTLTEAQVKTFAEALGLDADEVTAEELLEAAAKKPEPKEFADSEELKDLKAKAERGEAAATKLYEMERASVLEGALDGFKIKPADREEWERRYDENPDLVAKVLVDLPKVDEIAREFGDDDEGNVDDEVSDREFEELADYLGIREEDRAGAKKAATA